jgi:hypothetical protein
MDQFGIADLANRAADKPYNLAIHGVKCTNGGMLQIKHEFTDAELITQTLADMQKYNISPFPIGIPHVTIFAGFPCIYDDVSTYRYYIGSKTNRLLKSKVHARTTVSKIHLSGYGRALVPLASVIQRLKDNAGIFNDPLAIATDGKKTVITV